MAAGELTKHQVSSFPTILFFLMYGFYFFHPVAMVLMHAVVTLEVSNTYAISSNFSSSNIYLVF
jgi:hypothetical protein